MRRRHTAPREWARCRQGRDGIELLEASFDWHVYDRHMHDTFAIGVTLRGVQRFWCRGSTHDSRPGNVIVIDPGEVHDGRSGSHGGYAYRMLYVPAPLVHEIVSGAGDGIGADAPLLPDRVLARLIDRTWAAMAASPASLAADQWLHESVLYLARRHARHHRLPAIAAPNRPALHRVREYMREHLDRAVTVRQLATPASMSRFQLTRQFQKAFGLSLHAYQLQLRLDEAKRRLQNGDGIAAVASDLGFVDQSHLHRRFKASFGVTPGEWRRTSTGILDSRVGIRGDQCEVVVSSA